MSNGQLTLMLCVANIKCPVVNVFLYSIGKRCKDVGDADREENKSNSDIHKYIPSNESPSTSLFVCLFFFSFLFFQGGGCRFVSLGGVFKCTVNIFINLQRVLLHFLGK